MHVNPDTSIIMAVVILAILLTAASVAIIQSLDSSQNYKTSAIVNESVKLEINGVKVVVSDQLGQGSYGRYIENRNTIYIKNGRTLHKMKDTCEHELMHLKGISPENHEYIYRNQGNVNSDFCTRFIYELGKSQAR